MKFMSIEIGEPYFQSTTCMGIPLNRCTSMSAGNAFEYSSLGLFGTGVISYKVMCEGILCTDSRLNLVYSHENISDCCRKTIR